MASQLRTFDVHNFLGVCTPSQFEPIHFKFVSVHALGLLVGGRGGVLLSTFGLTF